MSSISAKIAVLSKAQAGKLSELYESICETMENTKLSKKETEQLCNAVMQHIYNESSTICCSAIDTVKKIIESKEYPSNFPKNVLIELKKTIGHHKKKPRNSALNMANDLLPIVTPEVFWETMSDALQEKNPYLKESALILFRQTLITFPNFKVRKYLKPIFSIFKDPQEIPRQHAFMITQILYQRNPIDVEKLLKNQFSYEADGIIARLKEENQSDTSSVSSKSSKTSKSRFAATASYSAAMNAPKIDNNGEIEDMLIASFNDNIPDATPDQSPCPFKQLETKMKKSADWQDRMEGLKILLSHARGTQNPSVFIRDMRTIQDQFTDCLSDLRSALYKETCVTLVGLAQVFGNQLDIHSQWIISTILPRTSHGTFIIAKSSEMAVVKYVQYVQGKHIKNILLSNADNLSPEVKVTVIRAMLVAKKFWTAGMSKDFDEIIKKKIKNDKHKEVRDAAAAGIEGIRYIDFNAPPPSSRKSKIPLLRPSSSLSHANPEKENEDGEDENREFDNENENPNENENEDEVENDEINNNDDDRISNAENRDIDPIQKTDDQDEDNEAILKQFYDDKNTQGLLEYIQNNKPDLLGQMQNVIDLIILDLNDENGIGNATSLLNEMCKNYVNILFPFIPQLLVDLPEDEEYGMQCLVSLGSAFGDLQLARLLRQSNLSYANNFILKIAEKIPNDLEFQSSAVLNAICKKQYEKHQIQILGIIKNIYEKNPDKCENLFMAMPQKEREEILEEYRYQIPTIYQAFCTDKRSDMPSLLANEIEKAKSGNTIDFQLIQDVPKNDTSLLLLAIASIRESPEFDPRFVEYLINLTETEEKVVLGAVDIALKQRCENDPSCCLIMANNFIPNYTVFNSFSRSIKNSNKNEAAEALSIIKDQMIEGLQDIKTKYAVLSILANAIIYIGEEYRNFCGKLSFTNDSLLNMMILKNSGQQ